MSNSTHLVNLAILQTLKSSNYQDEIDLFIPYIAISIKNLPETPFTGAQIKEQISNDFGIYAPADVIDILLARAKNRGLVNIDNHMYFPQHEVIDSWNEQYESHSSEIEESISLIAESFSSFAKDQFNKEISKDQALSLIYDYLKENISESALIAKHTKTTNIDSIKNCDHLTASYIAHAHKNNRDLWPHFKMITRAVMLANYLTFANRISSKKKYQHVTTYLDTPIILGLLGYSGENKQKALREILDLLGEFDLDVAMLYQTLREVEGIFHAWKYDLDAKKYDKFNPKTLELLHHKKIDSAVLETRIVLLEKDVAQLGIRIQKGLKLDPKYNCDLQSLENKIRSEFYGKWVDPAHDADALNKIHNTRKGEEPKSLNEKFSIFITPNSALASISKQFFELSDRTIPYVASERWLATMFWFKHPEVFTDLPEKLLLTTAYGTMYSDNGFWKKFSDRLDSLHKHGQISEEDFVLVRYDSDLLLKVHEISIDKGINYSDEDIFDVVEGIKQKLLSEKHSEFQELRETTGSEIRELQSSVTKSSDELTKTKSRLKKISAILGTLVSALICAALVICVFAVAYSTLPIDLVNNAFIQTYKKSSLAVAAIIVTSIFSFMGTMFGINVITVYKWIRNKLSSWLYNLLLG